MPNIMDEYLVKLGTVIDSSGIARFQNALREMNQSVKFNATAMAASFLKAQTEIVGAFATIGGAALGLADKVAMADQEYRLFAMHMYMSKDAARGLKIAMDALGQPLENLSWDPELRGRTRQLITDQRAMAPTGDYEEQMRKIRDMRFELTRTEVAIKYLGMHVVQDFMKALGLGPDTLLAKLHNFSNWLTTTLPEISKKLATWFLPIWKDIKTVFGSVALAAKDVMMAFTAMTGALTGDAAMMRSTGDAESFGDALQKVAHALAVVSEALSGIVDLLAQTIALVAKAATGDFKGAAKNLAGAKRDLTAPIVGAILGTLGLVAASFFIGPEAMAAEPEVLGAAGAAAAGETALGGAEVVDAGYAAYLAENAEAVSVLTREEYAAAQVAKMSIQARKIAALRAAITKSAKASVNWRTYAKFGMKHPIMAVGGVAYGASSLSDVFSNTTGLTMDTASPELMRALWMAESGNSDTAQNPTSSAYGAGQLLNATARSLGVNKYDPVQNRAGSTALMNEALKYAHGDLPTAIATYHEGQPKMDAILAHKATLSEGAIYDVSRTLSGMGRTGDVNVGGVTIHITQQPGENAEHLARRTADAVVDKQKHDFTIQRNQQSFSQSFSGAY